MTQDLDLWRSADLTRWFLFDAGERLPSGDLALVAFDGRTASVDPRWVALYEIGEAEGREWAREALGATLSELKERIESRVAAARAQIAASSATPVARGSDVTPDAVPAILSLARSLPRVLLDGLSGRPERVKDADQRLAEIQARLNRAGIEVGDRLAGFAERLDRLRSGIGDDAGRGPL